MNQLLYVCLDGLGDDPIPELGGRTPLQAARTPVLDGLAAKGSQGLVHTVGEDIAPESDIAVFAILGYDPREEHPGRGVLEALGAGIGGDFRDGDLAYRVNFATQENGEIIDRRVGRDLPSEDAAALAAEVNDQLSIPGFGFVLLPTVEHRGALVLFHPEGEPLSGNVSNTDPAYAKQGSLGVALETFENRVVPAEPLDDSEEARRAADWTNAWVQGAARILEASPVNARRRAEGRLPANLLLTRDGGDHVPDLQPIRDRFGPSWGCFVEMPVERGIALVLGMAPVDAPTGMPRTEQYASWAALAAEALGGYDALYVHIKGPDVPAHDGLAEEKRDVIEDIDGAFFGQVLPRLNTTKVLLAITADHSTSCVRKAHTADPVPLLLVGPGVGSDSAGTFDERAARTGALGTLKGTDIMPRLVALLRG
jgi:2,3-bisphosphoglycerate-independent phosphoglycerate mutase